MPCEACSKDYHTECDGGFCDCDECTAYWETVAMLDEPLFSHGYE